MDRKDYLWKFTQAQQKVADAIYALVNIWYDDDDYDLDMNDYASDFYPFDMSLDEFSSEVQNWVDETYDKLQEEFPDDM